MRKTSHLAGNTTEKWKINKIRHYHNAGWDSASIAKKLDIETYKVINIIFDRPICTTILGHKDEPYYTDEMDYMKLGSAPLPNYRILLD